MKLLWDDDKGDGVWEGQSELSFWEKWTFGGHRLQVNDANSVREKLEFGLWKRKTNLNSLASKNKKKAGASSKVFVILGSDMFTNCYFNILIEIETIICIIT